MGEVLENGVYLPDEGERNAYNGLKGNWNTVDTVVAQVQALSSTGLIRKPVDELPTEDIETNVIYMLKAEKPNGDIYRIEYMYIDNHWDALGTSETTLDDYYTKSETDNLPAVKSGINATRVSNYDIHIADTDIHVTLANKATWDGKQNALDTAQTAAVNSGVTGTKVTGYDTHVSDTDIHVTASDKAAWNGKQDGLSQTQLAAVNSGITSAKVTGYDSHIADTDAHVTTADKEAWNGKQNALTQTQLDNIAAVPDKANSADLATVATTGDYGDLLNAPAIPTVNNATLTIQKNGTDVATFTANASSNVTANLAIPVNTSDLNNDAGFLTQHNPIDNELSATSENALQNKVVKSELDGKAPLVHTHAASDVTSGTFNIARIPNLDASKITSGTIDIARLPKGSLERLVKVANQAARYALTTDDVQLGDTVQQLDTGVMYVVTDETKLDSADGYTEFTAGAASSVPWSGVTGKPNDYPPSSHTHTKSQITDFPALATVATSGSYNDLNNIPASFTPSSHTHGNITNDGKVGTTANLPLITGTGGAVQAGSFGTSANTFCEGNDSRLSDARTPVAHTHTKSDVTDLLNSDFIPSSDVNYTLGSSDLKWKQIWAGGYKAKSTNIDFTDSTTTGSIQNWWVDALEKNGTGFFGVGSIRTHSLGLNEEHFRIKNAGGKWADLYIQLGDNNQFTIGTAAHSDVTNNGFRGKFTPLDSFIPNANNSYDLGSSSYQWNNLYAKNYYYNGTAWGLDKANAWSANNSFYGITIYGNQTNTFQSNSSVGEKGDASIFALNIQVQDKNHAGWSSSGVANIGIGQDQNGSYMSFALDTIDSNNTRRNNALSFLLKPTDNSHNAYFFPNRNNTVELGTSDNKWKTLNGINPGALSLPSQAGYDPIDTRNWDLTGNPSSPNWYTPTQDGWICIIALAGTMTDAWLDVWVNSLWGQSVSQSPSGELFCMIPVRANLNVRIRVKASAIYDARLFVASGNV